MAELKLTAKVENLDKVLAFVEEELERHDCPMRVMTQLNIAVEEIFVNIAYYAYPPEEGAATLRMEFTDDPKEVTITFIDQGKPYDPLKREDPDVTLSAEERQVGGLGIFMVKKSMDECTYVYENGSNILTIKKSLIAPPRRK